MASIRAPLNALLKKGIDYVWSKDCQTAFEEFKRILQSDLLLAHYDPRRPIVVAADACQSGIGGIGYHAREDGSIEAFMHVSRRLTPAETRYSQIEKEALALVWTIMRLHKYVYGRKFKLLTDHLPLLSIFGSKKGIPTHVANRIQRWAIKLMAYDFQIEHVKTDDFGHADVLSRLIAEQRQDNNEEMVIAEIKIDDLTIALVDAVLPVSFKEIVAATEEDQVLPIVMDYVRNGWPLAHKSTDIGPVSVFRRVKESLSLTRGALTYMDRTVIPPLLQKRVLAQLHKAHPGISRMTSVARAYVYWPGLDKCIKDLVNRCGQCQLAEMAPVKSLLSSWATPTAPWERVHCDFAGPIGSYMFFIMVDAYTKWPEVTRMTSTTADITVAAVQEACSRFGVMQVLVSDNGPQFTSESFASFCRGEGIEHIRTAPNHPQSNGQVERFVDTFKRAITKAGSSKDASIFEFLRGYRMTPNPAELMLGRKMRTPLDALRPPPTMEKNTKMERQFNKKHGARKRTFSSGDTVIF